jgi:hypothetical protein
LINLRSKSLVMLRKILIGLLVLLIVIQFIRPAKNQGDAQSPQDITHVVSVPDSTLKLLQTACYDCHSNNTNYPWYAAINPVGLWLHNHVREGKDELNFTTFAQYDAKRRAKKMKEVAETVDKHEMPLPSYLWIHKEAILTAAQRQSIINWAKYAEQQLAVK